MKDKKEKQFVSLMNDFTIKTLLQTGNEDVINFFDRVLSPYLKESIKNYKLYTNELPKDTKNSIANRVDLLMIKEDNSKLNIEVNANNYYSKPIENKNMSYIFKIAGETYKGKNKESYLKENIRVKQINLNNFYCELNKDITNLTYILTDEANKIKRDDIEITNIYVPKLAEMCYDDIKMFTCESYEEMSLCIKGDKEREAIMLEVVRLSSDDDFLPTYDGEALDAAVKEEFEGIVTERVTKEVTKNVTKEVTKQVTDHFLQERIEIVKNMLNKGLSKEEIISFGFKKEEIDAI